MRVERQDPLALSRFGRRRLLRGAAASLAAVPIALAAGCASPITIRPAGAASSSAKSLEINLVYTGYGQGLVDTTPKCT